MMRGLLLCDTKELGSALAKLGSLSRRQVIERERQGARPRSRTSSN
jgi:hypothetical protein